MSRDAEARERSSIYPDWRPAQGWSARRLARHPRYPVAIFRLGDAFQELPSAGECDPPGLEQETPRHDRCLPRFGDPACLGRVLRI